MHYEHLKLDSTSYTNLCFSPFECQWKYISKILKAWQNQIITTICNTAMQTSLAITNLYMHNIIHIKCQIFKENFLGVDLLEIIVDHKKCIDRCYY